MKNVTTTVPRLHSCPYCGSPVHVSTGWGTFAITCDDHCWEFIRHENKIFDSESDCILDWQRRFEKES